MSNKPALLQFSLSGKTFTFSRKVWNVISLLNRPVICSDIGCKHLKKGMFFAPDPYIKMVVTPGRKKRCVEGGGRLPHHGQNKKSSTQSSTTSPYWRDEVIELFSLVELLFLLLLVTAEAIVCMFSTSHSVL